MFAARNVVNVLPKNISLGSKIAGVNAANVFLKTPTFGGTSTARNAADVLLFDLERWSDSAVVCSLEAVSPRCHAIYLPLHLLMTNSTPILYVNNHITLEMFMI